MKVKIKEIKQLIREGVSMVEREEQLHDMILSLSKELDKFTNSAINSGMSKDEYISMVKQLQGSFDGLIRLCTTKVNFLSRPRKSTQMAMDKIKGQEV